MSSNNKSYKTQVVDETTISSQVPTKPQPAKIPTTGYQIV